MELDIFNFFVITQPLGCAQKMAGNTNLSNSYYHQGCHLAFKKAKFSLFENCLPKIN